MPVILTAAAGADAIDLAAGLPGLEEAYDAVRHDWAELCRRHAADPGAGLSHTLAQAANISDFGHMLALSRLVAQLAAAPETTRIACSDPWLFRHLAGLPGVEAGPPPPLLVPELKLALRGLAARAAVSLRMAWAALRLKGQHALANPGEAALLVYGHPTSTPEGGDAYFGELMKGLPRLARLLHVDCPPERATQLAAHGRAAALHGFGSPLAALTLWMRRWRPNGGGWLVRRAGALEGSTGTAAMIAWQMHCQRRWLAACRPAVVAWPWENHAWERDFVRAARAVGTETVGYQHATVGWREWNYGPGSNPDGEDSLPDRILCSGPAGRQRLADYGCPAGRLAVAGALRFAQASAVAHDPAAPVFVALPFDAAIAAEMMAAIRPLAAAGTRFVVRDHPLAPFSFGTDANIARADGPLGVRPGVAAVLYCLTSVGLEALLAGLPVIRFKPAAKVAVDVLPPGVAVAGADAAGLAQALQNAAPAAPLSWSSVWAEPDLALWHGLLGRPGRAAAPARSSLARRLRQLADDPALRRWLIGRALGRRPTPPPFTPYRPPYLGSATLAPVPPPPPPRVAVQPPRVTLALAGGRWTGTDPFAEAFSDIETTLSAHRFAWLPLGGTEPAAVDALWASWRVRFGTPDDGWAWHPYTAAERAVNVLRFARRHGLPGDHADTRAVLAAHAPAIAARLEYFGEHYTGNHLANNGRGLYLLGLELGLAEAAAMGGSILLAEAARIVLPTGMLREGSSHYQLLVARNYVECWLAARRHGRPEAGPLEEVAGRMLAAARRLALPGGLALVGDVSPDCPPSFLAGLLPGGDLGAGWCGLLDDDERALLAALRDGAAAPAGDDGWLRWEGGDWAGLWYASPEGWPPMPGHGHHDLGSCELHWRGVPVFVDPGRGAYGEDGQAALYRSAAVHGLLQVDGADPTPPNRPYYDDSFRARIGGAPPVLAAKPDGVVLVHHGFAAQRVHRAERDWRFGDRGLVIADALDGHPYQHIVTRRLVTPWPVALDNGAVLVETPAGRLRVRAEGAPTLRPLVRWTAYGEGGPATSVSYLLAAAVPWRGETVVEEA
ncbi:MAG: heparinase II/III family protein [Actinomycetota bacterium]